MRAVTVIMCFTVVVFPNPIESMLLFRRRGREHNEIHAEPLELASRLYENNLERDRIMELPAGFYNVATEVENGHDYVIGYIRDGPQGNILCPFVNGFMYIKIRIDSDHANIFYPILTRDPVNNLFFKEYVEGHSRLAEIKIITESLTLVRANH